MSTGVVRKNPRLVPFWLGLGGVAIGAMVTVYVISVWTRTGRLIENSVLRGARGLSTEQIRAGEATLSTISTATFVIALIGIVLIAVLRRRIQVALAAATIVIGSVVLSQVLKRFLLPRPAILTRDYFTPNSFPSGHVTVALAMTLALLLVLPNRSRWIAALAGSLYTALIAWLTMALQWHRFSDTLGADLECLAVAVVVSVVLAKRGIVRRAPVSFDGRPRAVFTILVVAVVLAITVAVIILADTGIPLVPDASVDRAVYVAMSLAAVGAVISTVLMFWGGWARHEAIARDHLAR